MAANTFTFISSNVLGTSTASVTFSAIPSTFTDLLLRYSFRENSASAIGSVFVTFNGDSSALYSRTRLRLDNSNPRVSESSRSSSATGFSVLGIANSGTANTFSSNQLYMANYTGTTNKPFSTFDTALNNSDTSNDLSVLAGLYRSSSAITSITIEGSASLLSGSSFYLYGIKNS
jgi:hypothetical protein